MLILGIESSCDENRPKGNPRISLGKFPSEIFSKEDE